MVSDFLILSQLKNYVECVGQGSVVPRLFDIIDSNFYITYHIRHLLFFITFVGFTMTAPRNACYIKKKQIIKIMLHQHEY